MRVPSGAAAHLIAGLRLVAAHGILDGTGHDMVDARHAVGGRRTFKKYEFRSPVTEPERFAEGINALPFLQDLVGGGHEIKSAILFEYHIFY